jgi:hypothetical protein
VTGDEEVAAVDGHVKALDRALDDRPDYASPPFREVLADWERFSAHVALLDAALRVPRHYEASAILMTAGGLSEEIHELGYQIAHVGRAVWAAGDPAKLALARAHEEDDE